MTVAAEPELKPFVLLHLGERRFAVSAEDIAELAAPSRVFHFPHRTQKMEGVILRRGRIIPVCDIAEALIGNRLTSRRFHLIALRHHGQRTEWVALPVTGECELISAELTATSESDEPHVAGWLSHGGEVIEVLNLDALTPGPEQFAATPAPRARLRAQSAPGSIAEAQP